MRRCCAWRTCKPMSARSAAKSQLRECFAMLTERSARLMNLKDYGIKVGNPADIVVLDATTPEQAVAEIAPPLAVFKRGRRTVTRAAGGTAPAMSTPFPPATAIASPIRSTTSPTRGSSRRRCCCCTPRWARRSAGMPRCRRCRRHYRVVRMDLRGHGEFAGAARRAAALDGPAGAGRARTAGPSRLRRRAYRRQFGRRLPCAEPGDGSRPSACAA